MTYLAHKTEDGREQSVLEHAQNTAECAAGFAAPFGAADYARTLGLAHDVGKYSAAFQRRIRGENLQTDHSTAGAQQMARLLGWPAAYCVAGHHAGLPDGGGAADSAACKTLSGRLRRQVEPYDRFAAEIPLAPPTDCRLPTPLGQRGGFSLAFWIRMLFSCLVDADRLDTEAFMRGGSPRGEGLSISQLLARLEAFITTYQNPASALDRARCDVLNACLAAGTTQPPGLFTLTVPTGGGKTVSSLAFALRHAAAQGKTHIIYVIPYTNIIEQTADTFRAILGEEAVLEHHSGVALDDDEEGLLNPAKERAKLAAENWDLPVVVTTAVQFFESLYAARPSRCRKLHNLADSVIIFDEAQTLPLPYLLPCVRAITELVVNYGASCVLCTATQPALGPLFARFAPRLAMREIAPPLPQEVFRRVRYQTVGPLSDPELAEKLTGCEQALCIVGTRARAAAVYNRLPGEGAFHLSTLMTPAHRRAVLQTIKTRLREGLPCRVVSTSLVEAGVDLDFPTVWREEAGLDSMVQAAGRCNREGKRPAEESVVFLFRPAEAGRTPHDLQRPLAIMRSVLREGESPDSPAAIARYFTQLRHAMGVENLDRLNLISRFENGLQDPARPQFPFAEAAGEFHLIEQNTRTVLVPHTPAARQLAERLRQGERSRSLLRRAGVHAVSVYERHFRALAARGALCMVEDDLAVLTDPALYSEQTGLTLLAEEGEGIFL